jgi:hypothetical protein
MEKWYSLTSEKYFSFGSFLSVGRTCLRLHVVIGPDPLGNLDPNPSTGRGHYILWPAVPMGSSEFILSFIIQC